MPVRSDRSNFATNSQAWLQKRVLEKRAAPSPCCTTYEDAQSRDWLVVAVSLKGCRPLWGPKHRPHASAAGQSGSWARRIESTRCAKPIMVVNSMAKKGSTGCELSTRKTGCEYGPYSFCLARLSAANHWPLVAIPILLRRTRFFAVGTGCLHEEGTVSSSCRLQLCQCKEQEAMVMRRQRNGREVSRHRRKLRPSCCLETDCS